MLYEFIGFGGLGPRHGDLGINRQFYTFIPYWPWLLLGVGALLAVAFSLYRTRPPEIVWYLVGSLLVGMTIALTFFRIERFNFVARHMAALFPLFLITLMLWPKHLFSSKRARLAAIASLVVLAFVWGISDARLVFMDEYRKDSYREASSIAAARVRLDGGTILWAADPHTAHYYGIQVMRGLRSAEIGNDDGLDWRVSSQAIDARNWSAARARAFLDASTEPIILVLGRADYFDVEDAWCELIQQRRPAEVARLKGFMVYEWQARAAAIGISNWDGVGSSRVAVALTGPKI